MTKSQLDQYAELKNKSYLNPEEAHVLECLIALSDAETVFAQNTIPVPERVTVPTHDLEVAQKALEANPRPVNNIPHKTEVEPRGEKPVSRPENPQKPMYSPKKQNVFHK